MTVIDTSGLQGPYISWDVRWVKTDWLALHERCHTPQLKLIFLILFLLHFIFLSFKMITISAFFFLCHVCYYNKRKYFRWICPQIEWERWVWRLHDLMRSWGREWKVYIIPRSTKNLRSAGDITFDRGPHNSPYKLLCSGSLMISCVKGCRRLRMDRWILALHAAGSVPGCWWLSATKKKTEVIVSVLMLPAAHPLHHQSSQKSWSPHREESS